MAVLSWKDGTLTIFEGSPVPSYDDTWEWLQELGFIEVEKAVRQGLVTDAEVRAEPAVAPDQPRD
jgi:hypothetical protein